MTRPLPPLNALRAFEAAARHLSFSKAAAELHVTPAAISHQIAALEAYCGIQLFRRLTRALVLTEAAQAALPPLREGFERLTEAAQRLEAQRGSGVLTLTAPPSFAAKWLVPRLSRFQALHPRIDLRIDATDELADFARDGVDVGIRYGLGKYPGLRVEPLLEDEVAAVCSPRLLEGPHPLRSPADLRHHALLHVDWKVMSDQAPSWRMWLLAAGVDDVDATRGPRFSMESMALQAAIEGQGVALMSNVLSADDVRAGRLVRPFDIALGQPRGFSYWLVCPAWRADESKVKAFREWIFSEAAVHDETLSPPAAPEESRSPRRAARKGASGGRGS